MKESNDVRLEKGLTHKQAKDQFRRYYHFMRKSGFSLTLYNPVTGQATATREKTK